MSMPYDENDTEQNIARSCVCIYHEQFVASEYFLHYGEILLLTYGEIVWYRFYYEKHVMSILQIFLNFTSIPFDIKFAAFL